jgi:hypothetical protein
MRNQPLAIQIEGNFAGLRSRPGVDGKQKLANQNTKGPEVIRAFRIEDLNEARRR